jgi:acetylornithine deacetylase/succinyl-diaminopimelate desuccinylase-like protein
MSASRVSDRVLAAVESSADEIVDFTSALIRVPTVNPPGEYYLDCARLIGARLAACGFDVEYHAAEGRPEHTTAYPRVNVVGTRAGAIGASQRPPERPFRRRPGRRRVDARPVRRRRARRADLLGAARAT